MSGIINKVKDTIAHHKEVKAEEKAENHSGTSDNVYDSTKSSNYGPHSSNVANEADPRVDSDRSNLTGSTSQNYGPHDSNIANKADPRVDSDLDSRKTHTTGPTSTGAAYGSTGGAYGSTGNAYGSTGNTYDTTRSSNYGPHDSNLANKADPRVDSDLDSRNTHSTGPTSTGAAYGSTGNAYGSTGNTYDTTRSSNYGPHDSNLANKADPRVDSDLDSRHTSTTGPAATGAAYGSTGNAYGSTGGNTYGSTGNAYGSTGNTYDTTRSSNYGPHDSNAANKMDPRVDSDLDGRNTHHSTSSGHGAGYAATGAAAGAGAGYAASHHPSTHSTSTGPATSTTGPHSSNLENRMDPRVDSDTPNDRYSGSTGPASSTAGPHKSNVANEADPRVDSDRSRATYTGNSQYDNDVHKASLGGGDVMHLSGNKAPTTTQTFEKSQNEDLGGHAAAGSSYTGQKTVGPHDSDVANKLDPRVDSDLDGSKTLGSQRV